MKEKKKIRVGAPSIIVLISLYLMLPLVLTFFYSIFTEWNDILPKGFTLKYYVQLFSDGVFLQALGRTILISILPILITGAIILLAMYVIVVHNPKLEKYIQLLCMIPYALQGIILSTSIISLYVGSGSILSNRILLLTGAYCIIILPYMYQGIRNSLTGVDAISLIEAAQVLGVSKLYAFFRIIVPNILPGITVSAMLSMAMIFGDFAIVNTLAGSHYGTAQVYLQKKLFQSGQLSSATIMVLFLCTLGISLLVFMVKKKDLSKNVALEEE
ncbi:MAG: ABC transporter permease subunit [Clostridium sp.]